MLNRVLKAKAQGLGAHLADGKLCILAGAGISRLAPANLPGWIELVTALDDHLKTKVRPETLQRPLDAMSIIEARLGRGGDARKKLAKAIGRLLPSTAKPTQVHQLLIGMRCPIFTTNIDNLFEQADQIEGTKRWFIKSDGDLASNESGQRLIKLHGDLRDSMSCVLTGRDYWAVMNGNRFQGLFDQFRSTLQTSLLMLLGHSLSDPDLTWALDYVNHLLGVRARKPLLVTRTPTRDERTLAEAKNIALIELADFSQILPFCNEILLASSKKAPKVFPVQPVALVPGAAIEAIHEAWEDEARRIDDLLKARDYGAAQTAAREWEQRIIGMGDMSPAVVSRIHRIKAICLREFNQLPEANDEIEAALAQEPRNPKNWVHKAVIAYASCGPDEALRLLRGKGGIDAKRIRAAIDLEAGNAQGVRRLMKTRGAQSDADCHMLFAHYYLQQNLQDRALRSAQRATELSPTSCVLESAGDIHFTVASERMRRLVDDQRVLLPDLTELPVDGLVEPEGTRRALEFYQRAFSALGTVDSDVGRCLSTKIAQCTHAIADLDTYRMVASEEHLPPPLRKLLAAKPKPSRKAGRACAEKLTQTCRMDQEYAQALFQAAHTLADKGFVRAALGVLDCAEDHLAADVRVFYHWLRATCLLKLQGLTAAISEIQKARTTPQGMPAVWLYKARLCAAAQEVPAALRWFKKAHRSGQFKGSVLYHYSKFMVAVVRDYGKAVELLAELIQILPSFSLRENFIQAALHTDREEWHSRAFSEARALSGEGRTSRVVLSALVHCYQTDRDWRRARETAEEYLSKWPDDLNVRNNYAAFLSCCGQADAALVELDRVSSDAEAASEDLFRAMVNRVQVLIEAERYPEAFEAARRAKENFPDRPETWLVLMRASQLTGKEADLTLATGEFHRRFPDNPAVQMRHGARPLVRLIKRMDAGAIQARTAYLARKIPIHLYAHALKLPLSVVWLDLSRNGRIASGLYSPPAVAAEAKRIDDAKGLVLDYTALLALDALDLWGELAHLPECRVSESLVAQLRQDRHSVQGRLRPEHLARCEAIVSCLRANANVHVREQFPGDQIPKAWVSKHDVFTAADLWEATAESGVVLDDLATRLRTSLCLRTNQLLLLMTEEGWLSQSEFDRCISELSRWPSHVTSKVEAPLASNGRTVTTPVVISRNGLDALCRLGVLEAVIQRCSKIVVSLPTWNHFVGEVAKLRFWGEARDSLDRLMREAKQLHCQAVTASELRDAGLEGVPAPEALRANWFLAREEGWLLWSDDGYIRATTERASQLKGTRTTTTVSFLSWLRREGHIAEDDYHRAICKLVGLRYEYILLEAETLQWVMNEYKWHPGDAVAQVLGYFARMFDVGRPGLPAIQHFHHCFDVLVTELWQQRHLTFAEKAETSNWVCENIFSAKWTTSLGPGLTTNLIRLMLARVATLPLARARPFAAWVGDYARKSRLTASRLSEILSDFANCEGESGVTGELRAQFFAHFVDRLPVFLQALVTPSSSNARRLRKCAEARPVKVLKVQTAAGSVCVHEDDLLMPAELEVARRGKRAIDKNGLVQISFKPARFAMPEKCGCGWKWPSFPDELEARIGVRAVELLTARDPNVREVIADRVVGELARARSVLSCHAVALRDGTNAKADLPRELLRLLSVPAVGLELRHGKEISAGWFTEFVNTDPRVLHELYCTRRDDGSSEGLLRTSDWPRSLHELPPRVECFAEAAKKMARSQQPKLTSALIGVIGSTYDPFALGVALEALCQASAQGKRLGPRQTNKVRRCVTSALGGFHDDHPRRERARAFCQILRATSWVVRERGLGSSRRKGGALSEEHILETVVPTTRDIARVLRLGNAGKKRAMRVARNFSEVENDLLLTRSGGQKALPLRDLTDYRCADYWSLTNAVVADILAEHPAFLRRLADPELSRWLKAFMAPILSCFSLPKLSNKRLRTLPRRQPARAARDAMVHLFRSHKRKQEVLERPLPTWGRASAALRKAGPAERNLAFRGACFRVLFMTKAAVNRLIAAAGGAEQFWADAEGGATCALEFAWLALGMLDRKSRGALIMATNAGILRALQSKRSDAAILGCGCLVARISKLTGREWQEVSDAAVEAIRSEVLPEVARRNTAAALLTLSTKVGRLNCELARKAALDVFPDLAEQF